MPDEWYFRQMHLVYLCIRKVDRFGTKLSIFEPIPKSFFCNKATKPQSYTKIIVLKNNAL